MAECPSFIQDLQYFTAKSVVGTERTYARECKCRRCSHRVHDRGHAQLQQLPEVAAGAGCAAAALAGLQLGLPRLQCSLPLCRMPAHEPNSQAFAECLSSEALARISTVSRDPERPPFKCVPLQCCLQLCRVPARQHACGRDITHGMHSR